MTLNKTDKKHIIEIVKTLLEGRLKVKMSKRPNVKAFFRAYELNDQNELDSFPVWVIWGVMTAWGFFDKPLTEKAYHDSKLWVKMNVWNDSHMQRVNGRDKQIRQYVIWQLIREGYVYWSINNLLYASENNSQQQAEMN